MGCNGFMSSILYFALVWLCCLSTSSSSIGPSSPDIFETVYDDLMQQKEEEGAKPVSVSKPVAIVTGANSGLGKECSRQLAGLHGYKTVMACRNMEACEAARQEIIEQFPQAEIECEKLDLGSLDSVAEFASHFGPERPVKALVHNAGVMGVPFKKTQDGFETTFQTNHLAPFYLTKLLLPSMGDKVSSGGSGVVFVSSGLQCFGKFDAENISQENRFNRWLAYCNTKLFNIMVSNELHDRFKDEGIRSTAMRPGTIATGIARNSKAVEIFFKVGRPFFTPVQEGAAAVAHLVLATAASAGGGIPATGTEGRGPREVLAQFYDKFVPKPPSFFAQDRALCGQLWRASEEALKLWATRSSGRHEGTEEKEICPPVLEEEVEHTQEGKNGKKSFPLPEESMMLTKEKTQHGKEKRRNDHFNRSGSDMEGLYNQKAASSSAIAMPPMKRLWIAEKHFLRWSSSSKPPHHQ